MEIYKKEYGKDRHHSEPWYSFLDLQEHLRGYMIMDYLQEMSEEEKTPQDTKQNQVVKNKDGEDVTL